VVGTTSPPNAKETLPPIAVPRCSPVEPTTTQTVARGRTKKEMLKHSEGEKDLASARLSMPGALTSPVMPTLPP
jgi:hypothetical protein